MDGHYLFFALVYGGLPECIKMQNLSFRKLKNGNTRTLQSKFCLANICGIKFFNQKNLVKIQIFERAAARAGGF